MKNVFIIGAAFASLALAACGGGGGGITPTPIQTLQPKPSYQAKISWFGSTLASTTQSVYRQDLNRHPMTTGTPSASVGPVLLTANANYVGPNSTMNGAVAAVDVAPSPSPMPSPTWSTTSPNVSIGPEPTLAGSANLQPTDSNASSGTLTANVPSPVGTTTTTPLYVYLHLALECHHTAPNVSDNGPEGYAIQNGKLVETTDPSTSDIYVDGPNCYGTFNNPTETDATIHFPHGGMAISSFVAFNTITASSMTSNTATSVMLDYTTATPPQYAILFQDAAGDKAKLVLEVVKNDFPNPSNSTTTSEGAIDGPYCVFGNCPDGT